MLYFHRHADVVYLGTVTHSDKSYSEVFGSTLSFFDKKCENLQLQDIAAMSDIVFLATPHGYSATHVTKELLGLAKFVDLSADFRFSDIQTYRSHYEFTHTEPDLLGEAVYGLPELFRSEIREASLVANPGCYPTSVILALYPLLMEGLINDTIIIDSKSGVSGAGRNSKLDSSYCEVNDSFKVYGVNSHRHRPEIESILSRIANRDIKVTFTPHLVPMTRGILSTMYSYTDSSEEEIRDVYSRYYGNEKFIRLLSPNVYPQTRWVKHSNFIDISFCVDTRINMVTVVSAIDNLVRGASGGAVMNMNIMCGFSEQEGLDFIPAF